MVLVIVGRAPLGHAYHFPLISIRFGAVVGKVVVAFAYWFWWLVVKPPRAPLLFPLISIKFGGVFDGFGFFCLMVFVVFGRAPLGHPLPFLLISIRFGGF